MDFDNAKENIQPLASGRNAERLEAALNAESQHEMHEQMIEQRREFERAIDSYAGYDPLDDWYEYILWIEQSYPKSGKETALNEVISTCLAKFENDERYKQDRRMIKLFIKYIDSEPNPHEYYELLYNNGIGTMVADLYLCWAHYYDYNDNFEKAESVYQKGLDARAQPLDQLEQAHRQFGFSMSQRLLHKDVTTREKFLSSMDEKRLALTSLRAHKHRHVGSIRTGSAVKSYNPGRIEQQQQQQHPHSSRSHTSNQALHVFEDENGNGAMMVCQTPIRGAGAVSAEPPKSVVQTILSSAKKQENLREPGPWNNVKLKTSRSIVGSSVNQKLPFDIMTDDDLIPLADADDMYKKGIQLPSGFVKANLPQTPFDVPLHRDDNKDSKTMPGYDKFMLFPAADKCYSSEELRAYNWWKKRNVANDFTRTQDAVWESKFGVPVRLPPYFYRRNDKQNEMVLGEFDPKEVLDDGRRRFAFNIDLIYTANEEYSMEELLQSRWLNGELASQRQNEMDITCEFMRRESVFVANTHRRSVALGGRQSILPPVDMPRKSILRKSIAPSPSPDLPSTSSAKTVDDAATITKRKTEHEMKSPPHSRRKFDEEPVNNEMPKFEIFTDDKDLFKTPKLPPATARSRVSSAYDLGDDNEGCTTQTFNFFIKQQAVSTPKVPSAPVHRLSGTELPKRNNLFAANEVECDDKESEDGQEARQPFAMRMSADDTSPQNYTLTEAESNRRKLSAILETTEDTNTMSSAATTSSKSSSVEDSCMSILAPGSNKSSPLATINEVEIANASLARLDEVSKLIQENVANDVVADVDKLPTVTASALPFEIYDDNATKSTPEEPPTMCVFNMIEEKTETIPQFQRNQTIDIPLAEPTVPISFFVPPIDESLKPPTPTPTASNEKSRFELFVDDAVAEQIPNVNQTVDRSVFNFGNDASILPLAFEATKKSATPEIVHTMSKLDLSAEPVVPINDIKSPLAEKCKFVIFQDNSINEPSSPVDAVANTLDLDNVSVVKNNQPNLVAKSNSLREFRDADEKVTSAHGKSLHSVVHVRIPSPKKPATKTFADIDDEYYQMIQSPEVKTMKSFSEVVAPKHSLANKTDNDRSKSLLQPMKDISLTEHQKGDKSAVTLYEPEPEPITPIAQYTFSEDNPNTEMFSLHMPSIKNSTFLERGPSPTMIKPNAVVAPLQQEKKAMTIDDEYYALISSPLPPAPGQQVASSTVAEPSGSAKATQHTSIDKNIDRSVLSGFSAAMKSPIPPARTPSPIAKPTTPTVAPTKASRMTFDDEFYALMNSPVPSLPTPKARTSRTIAETKALMELSGIELNESEMKLLRNDLAQSVPDISFPKIQISEPKTIRPSAFNRMTAHFTIPDSPEATAQPSRTIAETVNDESVFIVEATEDLAAIARQSKIEEQSCVGPSANGSFYRLNQTGFERKCSDSMDLSDTVNPFELDVQNRCLGQIHFVDYITELDNVHMVNRIHALQADSEIAFGDKEFHIVEEIGRGSFGFVYSGECLDTKKMYAFKQERPANLWEFYISLELRSRIVNQDIFCGFLDIEYALIGHNSSVFASEHCAYGSLIDICNKHKEKTFRNMDELIVMIFATQILTLVDHMHASNIIHADIKPDNFLMMKKLEYPNTDGLTLKLIDYGQSIDLNFFPGRTFTTKLETPNFICTEMMDDKPWTFQIDLFCVASTIYSILCGKYMNVKKMPANSLHAYTLSEPLPNNLDTKLWMNVLHTLINVRDCDSMPNLQDLRCTIKEVLYKEVNKKLLEEKIAKFNSILG